MRFFVAGTAILLAWTVSAATRTVSYQELRNRPSAHSTAQEIRIADEEVGPITVNQICHSRINMKSYFFERCPMDYVMTGIRKQADERLMVECGRLDVVCQ